MEFPNFRLFLSNLYGVVRHLLDPLALDGALETKSVCVWCLLFILFRHGKEGDTSFHAGLERLGKETGDPV